MKFIYIISVIYLLLLFLLYKKSDKKICILSMLVYVIGLLFCYNNLVVYLLYLLKIDGSLGIFSGINFIIGTIIGILILKSGKKIQKYSFDKKKFVVFLCLAIIIFLIGYFRFGGFNAISYESGDSSIHYKHALAFSKELSILDINNSTDLVYKWFVRVIPISYVNCGLLFNILSVDKPYILFSIYNVFSLILCSLLFFCTIIDIFKYKKNNYIYALIFTLFYILSFPLNSFILGFCYLSICIMVINLLYLTIYKFKDDFDNNILFKLIIILLITFSIFFGYYLFVPAIYLALGIYYIYMWKRKKINFKQMVLYGVVTLIIPFIIGFHYFFITLFADSGVSYVGKLINTWGYSYDNITPIYLVIGMIVYLVLDYKKNKKINYLKLNIYIITGYIVIFLLMYIFRMADLYYFYKLFYLYWFFLVIYFCKSIFSYKKWFYSIFLILTLINVGVSVNGNSDLSFFFMKTNVYSWNARMFADDRVLYTKKEMDLVEESIKYKDICVKNDRFILIGDINKNIWYYAITGMIPTITPIDDEPRNLYALPNLTIKGFDMITEFSCAIYFKEDMELEFNKDKYEVLYSNSDGAILKRIKK